MFFKTPTPEEMNLKAREEAARDLVRYRLALEQYAAHVALLERRIARIDAEMRAANQLKEQQQ